MKKLTTIVASATVVASPVFETPADAVMVGLLIVIAGFGVATVMEIANEFIQLGRAASSRIGSSLDSGVVRPRLLPAMMPVDACSMRSQVSPDRPSGRLDLREHWKCGALNLPS
jgi:hypothetical protein